ncbi:unnamed protein product, partial [Mesorhabditis spiculigera]
MNINSLTYKNYICVYTCKAESEHGLTSTSAELRLPLEKPEKIEKQEEHTVAPAPGEQELEFASKTYEDSAVFQKKRASKDEEAQESEKADVTELKKKEEEYKLLVKVADSVAHSIVANIFMDAMNEAVKIIVRDSSQQTDSIAGPPRFDSIRDEFVAREGEELKIETRVYGTPTPFVSWYRGEQKLNVDRNTTMAYDKSVVSLTLKNAEATQAGTYYCHATNVHGTAVLSLRVVVESAVDTEDENSMLQMTVSKFVKTEDGSTVSTNVKVNHRDEEFEHKITVVEPEKEVAELETEAVETSLHMDIPIKFEMIPAEGERTSTEEQVQANIVMSRGESDVEQDLVIVGDEEVAMARVTEKETLKHTQEVMQTKVGHPPRKRPQGSSTTESMHSKSRVLLERPGEKAALATVLPYEEKARVLSERILAAQQLTVPLQGVNEVLSTVLAIKHQHKAYEAANVEVRRTPYTSEHVVTVLEGELENISLHINVPSTGAHATIGLDTVLQRPSTSQAADTSVKPSKSKKKARAEHRIVILEGVSKSFKEAITWSIKKVQKALGLQASKKTGSSFELSKPGEEAEDVTATLEMEECVPELLSIAASAAQVKLQNVTVSLVKQGDAAHQELVIAFEGAEDEEADAPQNEHGVADLVFDNETSRNEEVFRRAPRDYANAEEEDDEVSVVAVFVEVDASCPDQSVEIVATVSSPDDEEEIPPSAAEEPPKMRAERSFSISESISTALQPPKFHRKLTDKQANPGEPTTFKCIVTGMPTPEVAWTVDGDVIKQGEDYDLIYEDGVCLLKIVETLPEDEGEYQCQATNPAGTVVTKCFLKVLGETVSERSMPGIRTIPGTNQATRFIQHAPSKVSMLDEEEADADFRIRLSDSPDSTHGRLVTAVSDFELFRIVNYNEDLKERHNFYKYYETSYVTVRIRELVQEEFLYATLQATPGKVSKRPEQELEHEVTKVPPPVPPRPSKELINMVRKTKSQTEVLLQKSAHCFVELELRRAAGNLAECQVRLKDSEVKLSLKRSLEAPFSGLWKTESRAQREEGIRNIAKIAQQVEAELGQLAHAHRPTTTEEQDLKEIERSILAVAESLMSEKPVSKAQAEAKKELLRAALADMILNPPSTNYGNYENGSSSNLELEKIEKSAGEIDKIESSRVKSPIQQLRENLDVIEESLMEEVPDFDETSEILDSEVRNINLNLKPPKPSGLKSPKIKRVPSQELMRMTPLTTNIRDQLDVLETLIEEAAKEERNLHNLHNEGDSKSTVRSGIHDLFVQINAEIITIKQFCGKKLSKKGADAVMQVLKKLKRREQAESAFATVIFRSFSRSHSENWASSSMRYSYSYKTDKSTDSLRTLTLTEADQEGPEQEQDDHETTPADKKKTDEFKEVIEKVDLHFSRTPQMDFLNAIIITKDNLSEEGSQPFLFDSAELLCTTDTPKRLSRASATIDALRMEALKEMDSLEQIFRDNEELLGMLDEAREEAKIQKEIEETASKKSSDSSSNGSFVIVPERPKTPSPDKQPASENEAREASEVPCVEAYCDTVLVARKPEDETALREIAAYIVDPGEEEDTVGLPYEEGMDSNEMLFVMEARESSVDEQRLGVYYPQTRDETSSMQLVCEESDAGTDTENSGMMRGQATGMPLMRQGDYPLIRSPEYEDIHGELLEEMRKRDAERAQRDEATRRDTPRKASQNGREDTVRQPYLLFRDENYVVDESDLNSTSEHLSISAA